jgi:hypothetical protein
MANAEPLDWRVTGCSVRGASHARSGLPNQDALLLSEPRGGPPVFAAVADGHGSARYVRSHVGARLAVEAAHEVLWQAFVTERPPDATPTILKRAAEDDLPRKLMAAWRQKVEQHLAAEPLTAEDLAAVNERGEVAYGATVLAVLVTAEFIVYLQLGDGEVLAVDPHGRVTHPLPPDERLLGNETTSLCGEEAWRDVRVKLQWLPAQDAAPPPALILVATDGYPNSFRDAAGFEKVGSDLREMIEAQGLGYVEQQLAGWLEQVTQKGSGDDVTLALVRRTEHYDLDDLRRWRHQTEPVLAAHGEGLRAVGEDESRTAAECRRLRSGVGLACGLHVVLLASLVLVWLWQHLAGWR